MFVIAFQKLNSLHKGIIFICLASFFFSLMSAFVKVSANYLNIIEIIFLRSLISMLILSPFLKNNYKTKYYHKHLSRSMIGIIAMFLNFYAISKLPLSNFSIISFGKIFFIILLAFLFLKEKINTGSFMYIILGFFGILIILGFDYDKDNLLPFYLCAIAGTFLISLVKIIIKNIAAVEDNIKIQFYFSFNTAIVLAVPYFFYYSQLNLKILFLIFLISIFGLLAQLFTVEALKKADSIKVMPFDFSRVLFASIIGIVFFNDNFSFGMILGSLIIIFSGIKLIKKNHHN